MKSRIIDLDDTWTAVSPVYAHDTSVYFKNATKNYTAGKMTINTVDILTDVVDQSTNQFSNLYLTDNRKISDYIGMRTPSVAYPFTYVTYFAVTFGWVNNIAPVTSCWYVTDSTETEEQLRSIDKSPTFGFDRPYSDMSNEMLFEVELLDGSLLRISHWDTYKRSYLTVDPVTKQVSFDFGNEEPLTADNNQIFNYNLDEENSYINLYVNLSGQYYELAYNQIDNIMTLGDTTSDTYIPVTYKNAKIEKAVSEIPVIDNWVSYTTGLDQNNVNIDVDRSYTDISHNFLINTEYVFDDNTATSHFNILPLKNHLTNHLQLSRNNPFPGDAPTSFREYTSISTGTNQVYGYDNIYLNYGDFTELLTFPSDKLTYFHTPPDMYPYKQLNINDAGLVESGAIAGDQPIRSDKVFKKRANYEDQSSWGNALDEQSGEFLCSWLYWSGKENDEPVWLDRYYNPRRYTLAEALSVKPIVQFITTFDNMVLDNPGVEQYAVFDKISDLCFEPQVLYCYHRIGQSDITYSISRLESMLVQEGFDIYKNTAGSTPTTVLDDTNSQIYEFNGSNYAQTGILDGIIETNAFSLTYSMYAADWSSKFGHQIMGNFTDSGFAIYNNRFITNTLTVPGSSQRLVNTDLVTVSDIPKSKIYTFKSPVNESLYIYNYDNNGKLYEYDLNAIAQELTYVGIYSTNPDDPPFFPELFTYDSDYLYMVYDTNAFAKINLMTEDMKKDEVSMQHIPSTIGGRLNKPTAARAVDGTLYVTDTNYIDVDSNNIMWWLKNNAVYRYNSVDTKLYKYMESTDYIFNDLRLDVNDNLYIFYRLHSPVIDYEPGDGTYSYYYDHRLLKLDSNRNVLYNIALSTIQPAISGLQPEEGHNINLISEYASTGYEHYWMSVTPSLSTFTETISGEDVITSIPMIDIIKIRCSDGSTVSTSRQLGNASDYIDADSHYNIIKDEYRSDTTTNNLTFRLKLNNTYDTDLYERFDCTVDVSSLDPGWHQFSYDYASHLGKILLFIDGELVKSVDVTPDKYRFSDINIQSYKIGPSTFLNGIRLNEYLQQPGAYVSGGYKIKNFYMYNNTLNYYDLKFFYRQLGTIRDLKWTLPANSRNYTDEIQQTFRHQRSPIKSNNYNIEILCDAIDDESLRSALTTDLKLKLTQQTPINVNTSDVRWYDTK